MTVQWHGNIEKLTNKNRNYRKVLHTGDYSQLVLMSLKPHEQIGNEVHPKVDQFIRVEKGCGRVVLNNGKQKFKECSGDAISIPAGTYHNVINTSNRPLKLYTIYSPKNHPPHTIQKIRPKND